MEARGSSKALASAMVLAVGAICTMLCWPGTARAAGSEPCRRAPTFSCTTLTVPLIRDGKTPGSISLRVGRLVTGAAPSTSAVVALAGGPGQPALPLAQDLAQAISPALHGRDVIVFDQRGTGESDPLSCSALNPASRSSTGSLEEVFGRCALEIGAGRAGYTSEESAQDIEAIREQLGYQKLVLYGTSYGTKVALEYAERYPQNVEALVLDSVVPADGPEPYALASFKAMPRVLAEVCSHEGCKHITKAPVTDFDRLALRLAKHPLKGSVYDGSGKRHSATMDAQNLLDILEAGDLNPALRALLPAAVVSALRGYPDPLLQLNELSQGLTPNVPVPTRSEVEEAEDDGLFWATTCEERPFPWERNASGKVRLAQARAALAAVPGSAFYPFEARVAFEESLAPECAGWPSAAPAPPAARPLPDVPTLLLSGAQDLRTPTAYAEAVAAKIPSAQLLVVPYTGHSVIGSEVTHCAREALTAFFASQKVTPCAPSTNPFPPTPITPTGLASLAPARGLHGRRGRTLAAVLQTLVDLERQVVGATIQAETKLPSGSSFGGLRGGYAKLGHSTVQLDRFSFIPGVNLSGTLTLKNEAIDTSSIHIAGRSASHGTVHIETGQRVAGKLGGRSFNVALAKDQLAAAV
jgi:pimeloyl-ACP methyl ester carboxylesterase